MKKKKSINVYEIAFILLIILAVLVIYFSANQKIEDKMTVKNNTQNTEIETIKECEGNETKECLTLNNCDGTIMCKNNKWTSCYKNKIICSPGSTTTCAINPCTTGIKICNDCGTAWEKCISN